MDYLVLNGKTKNSSLTAADPQTKHVQQNTQTKSKQYLKKKNHLLICVFSSHRVQRFQIIQIT